MKYLQDVFDKILINFIQSRENGQIQQVHDGHEFEEIIQILLNSMYPNLEWKPTTITNDGSKDFWSYSQGKIIWAECKNYKSSIELKIIAPTLVMAQLCNANELFFFSVSPIIDNAKKKICYYSQINSKKVHFIDDKVLENLLLSTTSTRQYFSKITNIPSVSVIQQEEQNPTCFKFMMKNPYLNIIEDDIKFGTTVREVEYNDIISEQIFIINNNISQSINVILRIDTSNNDLYCFEYLESDFLPSAIHNIEEHIIIPPNGVLTKSYNFRIISYRSKLQLPDIKIEISQVKELDIGMKKFPKVECKRVGKTNLIGTEYEEILKQVCKAIHNPKRLTAFYCKGKSGVGKTRILEEVTVELMRNHYKILNFTGVTQECSFAIIREIIYVLYDVTEDIIEPLFLKYKQDISNENIPENIYPAMRLLYELHLNSINVGSFIKTYGELIFEKLFSERYALIIDNIQYYDEGMCIFLEELIMYAKNINRNKFISFFITLNDDYLAHNKPAQRILYLLEKLKNSNFSKIIPVDLNGMKEGSSLLYVKQLLDIKEETFDNYLYDLVKKADYNPFCIKYFADYIIQTNLAYSSSRGLVIKNHKKFIEAIDAFPSQIKLSFQERWDWLINTQSTQQKNVERNFLYILSCIHIFRMLTYSELVELGCKKTYIVLLEDFHFIKKVSINGEKKYNFEHDLIENFFEDFTPDSLFGSIRRLKNKEFINLYSEYPASCNLIKLSDTNLNIYQIRELILYGIDNEIPYRLFMKYEELSTQALIRNWNQFESTAECIDLALQICIKVRERFGGDYALSFFNKFYNILNRQDVRDNVRVENFSDMMFAICECFHHHTQYEKVINIYQKYLIEYETLKNQNSSEKISEIVAFIYNRLAIAYAHLPDKKSISLRDDYIEKSLAISYSLSNKQFFAESLYDKAEFYYYRYCDKEIFLEYCNQSCQEVDTNSIELMTLHNLQRKIRICFVEGNRVQIPQYIKEGFEYIEDGVYNEYKYFFSKFFHTAQAMYLLLEEENLDNAAQELHASIKDTHSFGSNNISYNQFLLGKIYYIKGEYEKSLEEYRSAYLTILNSKMTEKKFLLEILADDILIKIKNFSIDAISFFQGNDKVRLNKVLSMSDAEYYIFQKDYHAKSIITSDDESENFPSI